MTVADPWRLTRRDRAACALALECLRVGDSLRRARDRRAAGRVDDAVRTMCVGGTIPRQMCPGWSASRLFPHAPLPSARLLCARLALLLRAVLRADVGDYGDYGVMRYAPDALAYLCLSGDEMAAHGPFVGPKFTSRITPLWEQASK